jgi:parvulin-like peptidyl-prolyl isomerase
MYAEEYSVLNYFYQRNSADFPEQTEEAISDQVLSRWVNNIIIEQEAKKFDISVTDEQMELAKSELLANFEGEEDARAKISENYGWDLEKYIDRILIPLVLARNVEEYLASDEASLEGFDAEEIQASHILFMVNEGDDAEEVRAKANEVLQQIKDGADFAQMASEYGSDGTKDTGGDLGWFGRGQMVPEFEQAVFALESGQLGQELVETQFGYHIIKVTDKRSVSDYKAYVNNLFDTAKIDILIPVHNPFEKEAV